MLRSADVRLRSTILPFASRAILLAPLPIAEPLQDLPHVFANARFRVLFIDHRSSPKLLRSLRRSTGRRSERRVRASTRLASGVLWAGEPWKGAASRPLAKKPRNRVAGGWHAITGLWHRGRRSGAALNGVRAERCTGVSNRQAPPPTSGSIICHGADNCALISLAILEGAAE